MSTKLIDSVEGVFANNDGLYIKRQQFVPDSFLEEIRADRENSLSTPAGTLYRVASIPTWVIDKWHHEGFDYNHAPASEILRKLRLDVAEGEQFIRTKKRI